MGGAGKGMIYTQQPKGYKGAKAMKVGKPAILCVLYAGGIGELGEGRAMQTAFTDDNIRGASCSRYEHVPLVLSHHILS